MDKKLGVGGERREGVGDTKYLRRGREEVGGKGEEEKEGRERKQNQHKKRSG